MDSKNIKPTDTCLVCDKWIGRSIYVLTKHRQVTEDGQEQLVDRAVHFQCTVTPKTELG